MKEARDIERRGTFRALSHQMNGKHLTPTLELAKEFGRSLYPYTSFAVVFVEMSPKAIKKMYAWDKLDTIGPAYFATMELLDGLEVSVIAVCEAPHD